MAAAAAVVGSGGVFLERILLLCTCTGNVESENGGWQKNAERVDLAEQSLLNKLIRRSLVKNRNQVEVQQRDPTSPLFSVKTFEELRL